METFGLFINQSLVHTGLFSRVDLECIILCTGKLVYGSFVAKDGAVCWTCSRYEDDAHGKSMREQTCVASFSKEGKQFIAFVSVECLASLTCLLTVLQSQKEFLCS